jgi:hypothetical protein
MTGAASCIANMQRHVKSFRKAARNGTKQVTEHVYKDAKEVYSPYYTGRLSKSGRKKNIENTNEIYAWRITFGDNDKVKYALFVHEAYWITRNPHIHPHATAKFLWIPLERARLTYCEDIASIIKKETGI